MPIKKLDARTSEQIAAGEVIENPSSVVKELVENALDAGAKRIKVILNKGGLKEVTVIDDGSGIPSRELRLALERHATSKIKNINDLENISSLGFRGEALPSIASVSKMLIATRYQKEETGTSIYLEGGQEKEFKEIGHPGGTRVTVKDLFYNTPVRLKFLKGIAAETARVIRIINLLALSRPDVSFSLKKESGIVLETSGDGNLLNVISKIYGNISGKQLIPLSFQEEDLLLHGYISNPQFFLRNSRSHQLFFVNKRFVRSRLMRESLDKSHAGIVTAKRYPLAILFLSLLPENLDVNVHPTKIEVRFNREDRVRSFLEQNLKKAFSPAYYLSRRPETPLVSEKCTVVKEEVFGSPAPQQEQVFYPEEAKEQKYNQDYLSEESQGKNSKFPKAYAEHEKIPVIKSNNSSAQIIDGVPLEGTILGQVFATYLILQEGDNLIFVDQHAAHERIIWENMQRKKQAGDQYLQEIIPLPLELPLYMAEILKDKMRLFKEIGLEMEQFGNNTFIIRTVPFFFKDVFTTEMIMDICEELCAISLSERDFQKKTLLQLCCKAAIRANKILTPEESEALLKELRKCENPFFCPHGRPVMVKIPKFELEKYFKRRG